MDTTQVHPPAQAAPHNCCAEAKAAYQVLEMLLLALIENRIIDRDSIAAEIESLAFATTDEAGHSTVLSVRGALGSVANSLMAARAGIAASPTDTSQKAFSRRSLTLPR